MICYDCGKKENKNWIVAETKFDENNLGKMESIAYLGNGYMGIRSTTEERYLNEKRGMFVSGTFNKFDENEVTELPNVPEILEMAIRIDGETLDLTKQKVMDYIRFLNLKNGLLTRKFTIVTAKGKRVQFIIKRVVSLKDLHLIAQEVIIQPEEDIQIDIKSGINGQVSNTGAQHFSEGTKRLFGENIMQALFTTTESNIDFIMTSGHKIELNGKSNNNAEQLVCMERRKIYMHYKFHIGANEEGKVTKFSKVYTTRDKDCSGMDLSSIQDLAKSSLGSYLNESFDSILQQSEEQWHEEVWKDRGITIESKNDFDQLAIRFALYHLRIMTPVHDNRMNIGAKGLSGEGYKGHTFWDTEIFLLPSWLFTDPKVARSLLEYRFNCLEGAREKARDNGFEGAMFPWESAWVTDGEVTPKLGAADVITGKELPILTGFIELHITSDVAYAVWNYYKTTGDQEFMDKYGYPLIFETAKFWQSRLEWNDEKDRYEINDIIGPDEYKEHVNNNAFTNYMAYFNMKMAMEYYETLKKDNEQLFTALNTTLDLDKYYDLWVKKAPKIYLPNVNEDLLLPQDDTYLTLPTIDLKQFKQSDSVADIIKHYNMEQISEIQVSKQADVLVLFYLMEGLFSDEVKKANFYYYEDKCLHDSSLSLSTHCILANDLKENDLAYEFFRKASVIDLGTNMSSSNEGIHAASLGGLWQCVINGFMGVRRVGNALRINPNLPKDWEVIETTIYWQGAKLGLHATKAALTITNNAIDQEVEIDCYGKSYTIKDQLVINYN